MSTTYLFKGSLEAFKRLAIAEHWTECIKPKDSNSCITMTWFNGDYCHEIKKVPAGVIFTRYGANYGVSILASRIKAKKI